MKPGVGENENTSLDSSSATPFRAGAWLLEADGRYEILSHHWKLPMTLVPVQTNARAATASWGIGLIPLSARLRERTGDAAGGRLPGNPVRPGWALFAFRIPAFRTILYLFHFWLPSNSVRRHVAGTGADMAHHYSAR